MTTDMHGRQAELPPADGQANQLIPFSMHVRCAARSSYSPLAAQQSPCETTQLAAIEARYKVVNLAC